MKKTKNLLFTLLVMGLIATPTLRVNASTETVGNPTSTESQPEASEPEETVTPSDYSGTPAAPVVTPAPAATTPAPDAVDPSTTPAPAADPAVTPAPRVDHVYVKDATGKRLLTVNASQLVGSVPDKVDYKTTEVTFVPVDDNGDDMEGAQTFALADGENTIEYTIDGKTFTITISKVALINGLLSDVSSELGVKYPDYDVDKDTEKNALVIVNRIAVDDDKDGYNGIVYKYEYNVDTYKTVDAIMAAFAEAIKVPAPEADVSTSNGKLSDTAAKKLHETTKVVKAADTRYDSYGTEYTLAEWTIDATQLTNGFDLRVDIDNSVRKQTKDAIEKLLAETDVRRIVDFYHTGSLPAGTKVKIYAGDKFTASETLTLYYYNPTTNKLQAVNKDLKVDEKGFVEFTLDHCSSYVLLPSVNNAKNVQLLATKYNPQTGTMNVVLYAGIALASLVGIVVLRKQMN